MQQNILVTIFATKMQHIIFAIIALIVLFPSNFSLCTGFKSSQRTHVEYLECSHTNIKINARSSEIQGAYYFQNSQWTNIKHLERKEL